MVGGGVVGWWGGEWVGGWVGERRNQPIKVRLNPFYFFTSVEGSPKFIMFTVLEHWYEY